LLPRLKCVRGIENDETRKCVLLKPDFNKEQVEAFAKEKGYELKEEKVSLGYDNLTMSKHLLSFTLQPLITLR
jgi:hypothetical protein